VGLLNYSEIDTVVSPSGEVKIARLIARVELTLGFSDRK
jgi:hypothetical protein